jgi:hypothetical protein
MSIRLCQDDSNENIKNLAKAMLRTNCIDMPVSEAVLSAVEEEDPGMVHELFKTDGLYRAVAKAKQGNTPTINIETAMRTVFKQFFSNVFKENQDSLLVLPTSMLSQALGKRKRL